jgi:uncharacterized protein (DUF1015 family)
MQISPFKAYRFNPAVVGDDSACYAPPYDVIDDAHRQRLYDQSRYNIVRITKGITQPDDDQQHNQYTRAAEYLAEWIKSGVLKQDAKEAVYGYVQDFPDPRPIHNKQRKTLQRLSFIALAKLEEFGPIVKPHEHVLSSPLVDRLNLKKATQAEAGLVFMLYDDKQQVLEDIIKGLIHKSQEACVTKQKKKDTKAQEKCYPLVADFTDEQDVRHRLYAITENAEITQIVQMMSEKSCIIADGHHRYTTGLNYFKEHNPAAGYQMIAFSNINQKGLIVLATHRLVGNLKEFNFDKFLKELGRDFTITKLEFDGQSNKNSKPSKHDAKEMMLALMKDGFDNDKNTFGIYGANNAFYIAVLKENHTTQLNAQKSEFGTVLDVATLHKLILAPLLGIDEKAAAKGDNIKYVKGFYDAVEESIDEVDSGQRQVAFFLNPIKMEQLTMVTDAGQRMPQKSTFFYPKMFSGLTIQKI